MSSATRASGDTEFFAGIPVPVNPELIDREISRLWKPLDSAQEGSEPAVTRACLSNVIFYLPDSACCERANDLVLAVGRRFPSRMILLLPLAGEEDLPRTGRLAAPSPSSALDKRRAPPAPGMGEPASKCFKHGRAEHKQSESRSSARGSRLSASITAVCHPSATGGSPVCCEQITLASADRSLDVFPGAVSPLLVPDLPVNLVLLSDGGGQLVDMLSHVVDRVIFDSRRLEAAAVARVGAVASRWPRLAIDDVAWRDIVGWRMAVSEIFDDPKARSILSMVRSIKVCHVEGCSARAALLGGWLTSCLGRESPFELEVESTRGEPGQVTSLRIDAGPGESGAYLAVRRVDGARMLRIEYHTLEACVIPRTLRLRAESSAELLGGALERTTHQGVLRAAVGQAARWLSP